MSVQPATDSNIEWTTDASYPSAARGWWMAAVFCFAGFISYTDRLILSALVDPMRRDLLITDSHVSLLQGAAFAVVYVFSGLFLGRLVDRSRRLDILLAGATLWCFGAVLCGVAADFWALFGSRMLIGIGEAALAPAAISIIADSFPPARRGTAISVFLMGTVVGGPAAIAIGGMLLDAAEGGAFSHWPLIASLSPWRAVLVVVGVAGLLVPALFLTLREPIRRERARDASLASVLRRFVRNRAVLGPLYLAMALVSIGDYGLLSWTPSLLSRRFHWTPGQVGVVFGLITVVAGVLGSLAGGALSDAAAARGQGLRSRLGVARLAAIAGGVGAAMVATADTMLVLTGIGLWTFASAVAGIGGIVALQEIVPNEHRGVAISLVAFWNILLGLGFGPTLVAQVTERIYGDPVSVGSAIATVVVPAAALAFILFSCARGALRTP